MISVIRQPWVKLEPCGNGTGIGTDFGSMPENRQFSQPEILILNLLSNLYPIILALNVGQMLEEIHGDENFNLGPKLICAGVWVWGRDSAI